MLHFSPLATHGLLLVALGWAAHAPLSDAVNVLAAGHSFFMPMADRMSELASANSFCMSYTNYFRSGPPGELQNIINDVSFGPQIANDIATGSIDVIMLTVGEATQFDDLQQWVSMGNAANPNMAYMIGIPWPGLTPSQSSTYLFEIASYYAGLNNEVDKYRALYPSNSFYLVNYAYLAATITQDFEDGGIPGINSKAGFPAGSNIFIDPIGHPGTMITEIVSLSFLNLMFGIGIDNISFDNSLDFTTVNTLAKDLATYNAGFNDAPLSIQQTCASSGSGGLDVPCFSSANTVEVQGKGMVPISSVETGDIVRTAPFSFSEVVGFGRRDSHVPATYVQLVVDDWDIAPLELSKDHMVFVDGRAVAAADIKVGDILENGQKVLEIHEVLRKGAYAPVTENGRILLNGNLQASCYVKILDFSLFDDHAAAHAFLAPFRTGWISNWSDEAERSLLISKMEIFVLNLKHMTSPSSQYMLSLLFIPVIHLVAVAVWMWEHSLDILIFLALAYASMRMFCTIAPSSARMKEKSCTSFSIFKASIVGNSKN